MSIKTRARCDGTGKIQLNTEIEKIVKNALNQVSDID